MIKHLEGIVSTAVADKGLNYRIEVDPDLPAYIISDHDRLLKCLINLVANAVKYTRKGFIDIRVLSDRRDGKPCIRIDIADSGVGIRADKIHRLFEPALNNEDAGNEVLTMLDMGFTVTAGLPLTKQLLELLGGTLQVTSEPNVGSTFSVLIPVGFQTHHVGKLGSYASMSPQSSETVDHPGPIVTVLLVEDQPSNRTVLGLMLETLGVSVETAEDGQEGVEKASPKHYDLILMDLKMPRMDGYQATQRIREQQPTVPIVALSAKVLSESENDNIVSLFDGFLSKPVDSCKLSETVRKFIANYSAVLPGKKPAPEKTPVQNDEPEVMTFNFER